jgi:hypothetical protein
MLVQTKPVIKVTNLITHEFVKLTPESEKNIGQLVKSALKDIDVIRGTRSGRRWPRFEKFANTTDRDIRITVEYTIERI